MMPIRLKQFVSGLSDKFWLVPGLMVVASIVLAIGLLRVDHSGLLPDWLLAGWLYNGGGTGARTLLGVVASSTIGVAGTVFSITIAALSLAAGQMGPRLLRNFTHDRGNQVTLGIFLGTFSYALVVLRSVRTESEGPFTPHLALTIAILLGFVSVGTLVFFVGHMAGRINVDTVIQLVGEDMRAAFARLTTDKAPTEPPPAEFWHEAIPVTDARRGYVQQLDDAGLAEWAIAHHTAIRLLIRPGDYVFPGAPIALMLPSVEGCDSAIANATALGAQRVSSADLEFAVRQLVEVAVRALSPGINDPHTAISVLDRLGAGLCDIVPLYLPNGVTLHDGAPALVTPAIDYDGLVDAMFHMIRQNAHGSVAVLIRLLDVLTAVVSCEKAPERIAALQRHADLVLDDAERELSNPADLSDLRRRHTAFSIMRREGPSVQIRGSD